MTIAVRTTSEESQTITVHRSQPTVRVADAASVQSERKRLLRILMLLWLIASGQPERLLVS